MYAKAVFMKTVRWLKRDKCLGREASIKLTGALRGVCARSISPTEGVLPGNKSVGKGDKCWKWVTICMSQERMFHLSMGA